MDCKAIAISAGHADFAKTIDEIGEFDFKTRASSLKRKSSKL